MFWATDERLSGQKRIKRQRIGQHLRRGVHIGSAEHERLRDASAQLKFGAMRDALRDVHELSADEVRPRLELDQIAKKIVVVRCIEGVLPGKKILLRSRL